MKNTIYGFLAVILMGCATARLVHVEPGVGGEITISPSDSPEARQKGEALMRANCGSKPFKIVSESEVVTGSETRTSHEANVDPDHTTEGTRVSSSGSTYTQNTTEWRIKYKCGK